MQQCLEHFPLVFLVYQSATGLLAKYLAQLKPLPRPDPHNGGVYLKFFTA